MSEGCSRERETSDRAVFLDLGESPGTLRLAENDPKFMMPKDRLDSTLPSKVEPQDQSVLGRVLIVHFPPPGLHKGPFLVKCSGSKV